MNAWQQLRGKLGTRPLIFGASIIAVFGLRESIRWTWPQERFSKLSLESVKLTLLCTSVVALSALTIRKNYLFGLQRPGPMERIAMNVVVVPLSVLFYVSVAGMVHLTYNSVISCLFKPFHRPPSVKDPSAPGDLDELRQESPVAIDNAYGGASSQLLEGSSGNYSTIGTPYTWGSFFAACSHQLKKVSCLQVILTNPVSLVYDKFGHIYSYIYVDPNNRNADMQLIVDAYTLELKVVDLERQVELLERQLLADPNVAPLVFNKQPVPFHSSTAKGGTT